MTETKLENFRCAVANLEASNQVQPPFQPWELAGIVSLYTQALELAWKTVKAVLEDNGYYPDQRTGSPKHVLQDAYAAGMIQDEEGWDAALKDRNRLIHTYDEAEALTAIDRIRSMYLPLFKDLLAIIEQDWS